MHMQLLSLLCEVPRSVSRCVILQAALFLFYFWLLFVAIVLDTQILLC